MLLDTLLAQIAPHECLGCSTEGSLLCADCCRGLTPVVSACYSCRKLSDTAQTCTRCRAHSDLFAVKSAAVYEGLAKDLVWQLKFKGSQAAATDMVRLMAPLVPRLPGFVLVPVPTATSRIRRRGYDQATLIAKALARQTGVAYSPMLRRSGQHHQLGSSRAQRLRQLQEAYRVTTASDVTGRHVILIDDVLTTGATLEAAARAIKTAGAQHVSGLVFARA